MRTLDEAFNVIADRSAVLFRTAPVEQYRQTIVNRIEQVRGMVELARAFEHDYLAQRLETHLLVLKQTLDRL